MSRVYLFHGGAPGREVGDSILPPSITGIASTTLQDSLDAGMTEIAQRPDKVYMTSSVELARAYASGWVDPDSGVRGGGAVYQVEVKDGALELDEDLLSSRGLSFQADSAEVIAIQDKSVAPNPKRYGKVFRKVLNNHAAAKKANGSSAE